MPNYIYITCVIVCSASATSFYLMKISGQVDSVWFDMVHLLVSLCVFIKYMLLNSYITNWVKNNIAFMKLSFLYSF